MHHNYHYHLQLKLTIASKLTTTITINITSTNTFNNHQLPPLPIESPNKPRPHVPKIHQKNLASKLQPPQNQKKRNKNAKGVDNMERYKKAIGNSTQPGCYPPSTYYDWSIFLATNSASSIASIVYIAQSSALLTTTAPSSQKNHAHRLR